MATPSAPTPRLAPVSLGTRVIARGWPEAISPIRPGPVRGPLFAKPRTPDAGEGSGPGGLKVGHGGEGEAWAGRAAAGYPQVSRAVISAPGLHESFGVRANVEEESAAHRAQDSCHRTHKLCSVGA